MQQTQDKNSHQMAKPLYRQTRELFLLLSWQVQQALAPFNLSIAEYDTLAILDLAEGQRVGQLAERVLVDNSKMTRILDRLEEEGLARRAPDPDDRRAQLVYLSAAGAARRHVIEEYHQAALEGVFGRLEAAEQRRLQALLERLTQPLHEQNPQERT